ncbi:restriction endonuclease subunit S [Hydrogenoanaerobacterium saccharovorans]|uniref:Restriction endonuclease subunit S n=1 Tax=Hydrogenoanaerobacterium saccharovorans TaxID=474960 RepID=A0ABS2GQ67_9FIRM|nr:restriction endonuclease subunit S [Hydrogenoanaerobacterium saccharovorans]MBM6924278.1 restriction endonuclease subunit S [Hydrogenoanaerobacterium saccharovorans]
MTPQELKNSILQFAIQGKLVEQRPEEGTAEELFARIQQEKQRLIAEKKIKKDKPMPVITEDEKPFDIPESWNWVRLGDISTYDHRKEKISANEITKDMWSLDLEDIEKESGKIINICKASERKISGDKVRFYRGQILYSKLRPYLKKILVAPDDGICSSEMVPFNLYGNIDSRYAVYFLKSPHVDFIINSVTYGVKMPRVGTDTMIELPFPLPPLAEQKRIVAKIEELLPYIDRYEQAWSKLELFNTRFPEDMKKSLLQYAIQGKLVEQRPEEGTAEELFAQIQEEKQRLIAEKKIKKEKSLPEITEDEKPFDIPDSWKWVRFSDVIDVRDGTHDTPKYVLKGVPLVTSKNLVSGKIDFDTAKLISETDAAAINMRSEVNTGDILFAMIGTIGNPVLVKKDREFCIKNMALFKPIDNRLFNMSYLLLFLQKEQEQMKKVQVVGFNRLCL